MRTYGDYLAGIFPGVKVQKISVDAGFTCPNRDGTISTGGCSYCRNDSFSPSYCNPSETISLQIEKGKKFFSKKYSEMKFLAYFQKYTGTYSSDLSFLENLYREALKDNDVVGLVISTRPDCIPDSIINILAKINNEVPVFMEIGAESSFDSTLKLINRNHRWVDVEDAIKRLAQKGLRCGIHLIAGLPGENKEMILSTVEKACSLPIETLKLHQLQILKDTPLFWQWQKGEVEITNFSLDQYLNLCEEIIRIVPDNIIIERFLSQSPSELVVSPKWGLKNYQFMHKLAELIASRQEIELSK